MEKFLEESNTTAYIQQYDMREIVKTICAMSNTDGGQIYVGISGPPLPSGMPGAGPAIYGVEEKEIGQLQLHGPDMFRNRLAGFKTKLVRIDSSSKQIMEIEVEKNYSKEAIRLTDDSTWNRVNGENVKVPAEKKTKEQTVNVIQDVGSSIEVSGDKIEEKKLKENSSKPTRKKVSKKKGAKKSAKKNGGKENEAAQKQSSDVELKEIIEFITGKRSYILSVSDLSDSLDIHQGRVLGHLQNLKKRAMVEELVTTSDGTNARFSDGNFLELESLLNEKNDQFTKGPVEDSIQNEETPLVDFESQVPEDLSYLIDEKRNAEIDEFLGLSDNYLKVVNAVIDVEQGQIDSRQLSKQINMPQTEFESYLRALPDEAVKENVTPKGRQYELLKGGLEHLYSIAKSLANSSDKKTPQPTGGAFDLRRDTTAEERCLNADEQADVLCKYFSQAKGDLNFGLFGHWGRGKTYLMGLVGDRLKKKHDYEVIQFSAWKYRSTPELWAYLYETFASNARNSHFMLWFFTPFRVGLARYGIWPIVFALFALWFSLWPQNEKFLVEQKVLQYLGLATVGYLGFLYMRLQAFSKKLYKYFDIASHRSSLGLQAAIGDDLKALLTGWMPVNHWIDWKEKNPSDKKAEEEKNKESWKYFLRNINWFGLIPYSVGVALVAIWLAPTFEENTEYISLPTYGLVSTAAGTAWPIYSIILFCWILATILFPLLSMFIRQGPKRVLLVVDDLDRCQSDQMLEIVESIMLFLDDEEIKKRLQIAMLIEEESIKSAIERKYKHLFHSGKESDEKKRLRVVQENIEKIFLVYMRLPETNRDELEELFNNFINVEEDLPDESANLNGEKPLVGKPSDSDSIDSKTTEEESDENQEVVAISDDDNQKVNEVSTIESSEKANEDERPLIIDNDVSISPSEKAKILQLVRDIEKHDIRWGPRAVRCFINKYQLAREIFKTLNPETPIDPSLFVQALTKEELPNELEGHDYSYQISKICDQIR